MTKELKPLKWKKLRFQNGHEAETLVGTCNVTQTGDNKFKAYLIYSNDMIHYNNDEDVLCDTLTEAKKAAFLLYSKAIKSLFKEGTFNENGHERL